MKTTPIVTEDAPTPVQQIVEGSPSYRDFQAAEQRMRSIVERRAEVNSEIERLGTDLNRRTKPGAEAQDLIDGKFIASDQTKNAFQAAHRRLAIINEAMVIQQRTIIAARVTLSREVNEALRSSRQLLVSAVAASLRVIRAASCEDEALRLDLARAGIDLVAVDNLVFPPISSECAYDFGWLNSRRREGYQVD